MRVVYEVKESFMHEGDFFAEGEVFTLMMMTSEQVKIGAVEQENEINYSLPFKIFNKYFSIKG